LKTLEKFTFGIGDRFGKEGTADLSFVMQGPEKDRCPFCG
jgi:hypothetical protein